MWLFLEESPRYTIINQRTVDEGVAILKKMARINEVNNFEINQEETEELQKWVKGNKNFQENEKEGLSGLSTLFSGENKDITFSMWPICFIFQFVYYGIIFILPMVLPKLEDNQATQNNADGTQQLKDILYSISGEIPGFIIGILVIERQFFGRKNTIMIGLFGCAFFCLIACVLEGFVLWVLLARSLLNVAFTINWAYLTELYPTSTRATGFGWAASIGSIGGATMPWMIPMLLDIGNKAPFFVFFVLCAFGGWCTWRIKRDTTQRELDIEMKYFH